MVRVSPAALLHIHCECRYIPETCGCANLNQLVVIFVITTCFVINARRACARAVTVLTLCVCVCVCVCLEFAAFISRLYTKYDIPVYFSPVFLRFKFCRC